MAIQPTRIGQKLEFPAQGKGQRIDIPFGIYTVFSNAELAMMTRVCKAWQGFIQDVICAKSRRLEDLGYQLDPKRVLQTTLESDEELNEKIRQFIWQLDLDPLRANRNFICYGPKECMLKISCPPSETSLRGLRTDQSVFNPKSNDIQYLLMCYPGTNITWRIAHQETVELSLMWRDWDTIPLRGCQRGDRMPRKYDLRLLIQGTLPLKSTKPDAKALAQRVQNAVDSIIHAQSNFKQQASILFSHLPFYAQLAMSKVPLILIGTPCLPTVSITYFVDKIQDLECNVKNLKKACIAIKEILEDPRSELLKKKLGGKDILPRLPIREIQKLLEKCKEIQTAPPSPESTLLSIRERLGSEWGTYTAQIKSSLDPIILDMIEEFKEFLGPIRERHFPAIPMAEAPALAAPAVSPWSRQLLSLLRLRYVPAAAAVAPAAPPVITPPYFPLQEFANIARQAASQRRALLHKELPPFQRSIAKIRAKF